MTDTYDGLYQPSDFPSDNAVMLPSGFRREFQAIATAISGYTSTDRAVAGDLWYGDDSTAAGPNQYRIQLRGGAGDLDFSTGYTEGMMVWFRAKRDNTGPAGLSVNGAPSQEILNQQGEHVDAGYIRNGNLVGMMYMDRRWRVVYRDQPIVNQPANVPQELAIDDDFESATNDEFKVLYGNVANLKLYQQLTFIMPTPSGIRVGNVPLEAITEIGDDTPSTSDRRRQVNVFGDNPGSDDGPFLWLVRKNGQLHGSFSGGQDRRDITMLGSTLPSYVQGGELHGWAPVMGIIQQRVGQDYRTFLEVRDWSGGSPSQSRPQRETPFIVGAGGDVIRPPTGYTDQQLSQNNAISVEPFGFLSYVQVGPSISSPMAVAGNSSLTAIKSGNEQMVLDPYGGEQLISTYVFEQSPETTGPTAEQYFDSGHPGYDLRGKRMLVYLSADGLHVQVRRTPLTHLNMINATRFPILVAPQAPSPYSSSTPGDGEQRGRAFVILPGGSRLLTATQSIWETSRGSLNASNQWYAVQGPTGLYETVDGAVNWTDSINEPLHRMERDTVTLQPVNWSGIERLKVDISFGNAPANTSTVFPLRGHPDWGLVRVENDTTRVLQFSVRSGATFTVPKNEARQIDFQA